MIRGCHSPHQRPLVSLATLCLCILQEEKAERAEAERMRRKQSKQKAKDRLRTEKERAAAEREAKQKADLEEAQKVATASKERDELERCCTVLPLSCLCDRILSKPVLLRCTVMQDCLGCCQDMRKGPIASVRS